MKALLRFFASAISILATGYLLEGFGIHVADFSTAIVVAIVLGLLNIFLKPILVILTFPITIVTLGIFLIFINAFIIYFTSDLVGGFEVSSVWSAILFGFVYSIFYSVLTQVFGLDKHERNR